MTKDKNPFDPVMTGGKSARKQVHFQVKTVQRSAGQSAVASAAYISGEKLYDERTGRTFDERQKDDILHAEIMVPDNSPEWAKDRQELWNVVEKEERQKNGQPARNIIAALPRELSLSKNLELVRKFVNKNFVSRGMVADFAIHKSEASDGGKNPHVHFMLTMKEMTPEGFKKTKNRDWNKKAILQGWRESWAQTINDALEDADVPVRFDHRTLEAQGIDRTPTFHLGAAATAMREKGIHTDKGQRLMVLNAINRARVTVLAAMREEERNPNACYERYMRWKEFTQEQEVDIPTAGKIQIDNIEHANGKDIER